MNFRLVHLIAFIGLVSSFTMPANAQSVGSNSGSVSMASLVAKGYEIKAAVPNGSKYVVFVQKGKSAYACEFVTIKISRCGAINNEAN